jgi:hypothetical protein
MQETTTPSVELGDHKELERLKSLIDWAVKYQTEKAEIVVKDMAEQFGRLEN